MGRAQGLAKSKGKTTMALPTVGNFCLVTPRFGSNALKGQLLRMNKDGSGVVRISYPNGLETAVRFAASGKEYGEKFGMRIYGYQNDMAEAEVDAKLAEQKAETESRAMRQSRISTLRDVRWSEQSNATLEAVCALLASAKKSSGE